MTNRKLKGYVKPTIFMICLTVIIISLMVLANNNQVSNGYDQTFVMNALIDPVTPVVGEPTTNVILPYKSDKVTINKAYYSKDDSEEDQQNALIYYENTYLPNSGIIYASAEEFDVNTVLDGTVIDIKEDELLNTVVYVSHSNNITTIYYGLKDVNVKVNDQVMQGDILGKSNTNKFCSENYSLLFEVNNNGEVIDPEEFYQMDLNKTN